MTSRIKENKIRLSTTELYNQLKEDILAGVLPPGKKLVLKDLSTQYLAGNSPLREALTQLSSVGMVVKTEGRGFNVASAELSEMRDLTTTRCLVGEVALRESIVNGTAEWEERIVVAFHRLEKSALSKENRDSKTNLEKESIHRGFHTALVSACGSSLLIAFSEQLQTRAERFRNLAEVIDYTDQYEHEEHNAIKKAVLNRDIEQSIVLLKQHYTSVLNLIEKHGMPNESGT